MNTYEYILRQIIAGIAASLAVDKDLILPETLFADDLGVDSLDAVELLMKAEKAFQIRLGDDVFSKIRTVDDATVVISEAIKVREEEDKSRQEIERKRQKALELIRDASEKEELAAGLAYAKRTGFPYFTHDGRKAEGNDEVPRTGREASQLWALILSCDAELNDLSLRWESDVRFKNGSHIIIFPNGAIQDTQAVNDSARKAICDILTLTISTRFPKLSFPVTYRSGKNGTKTEAFDYTGVVGFNANDNSISLMGLSENVLSINLESGALVRIAGRRGQKAYPAGLAASKAYHRKLYLFLSDFLNQSLRTHLAERLSYCFGITKAPINLATYASVLEYNVMGVNYPNPTYLLKDGRVLPSSRMMDSAYHCSSIIQKLMLRKRAYRMDVLYGSERMVFSPGDILAHSDERVVLQGDLFNPQSFSFKSIAASWKTGTNELFEVNPQTLYRIHKDEDPILIAGNDSTTKAQTALKKLLDKRLAIVSAKYV